MSNSMVYEDYLDVALKHLKTCEIFKDNLNNVNNKKTKDYIIRNLYYLSGYILEGVINYCIYREIKRRNPSQTVDPLFEYSKDAKGHICYNYPNAKQKAADPQLGYIRWEYRITSHLFSKNKNVISKKLNAIKPANFRYINIIINKKNERDPVSLLFYEWNVNTVRYQTSSTHFQTFNNNLLTEQNVFNFFEFARETYKILPNFF